MPFLFALGPKFELKTQQLIPDFHRDQNGLPWYRQRNTGLGMTYSKYGIFENWEQVLADGWARNGTNRAYDQPESSWGPSSRLRTWDKCPVYRDKRLYLYTKRKQNSPLHKSMSTGRDETVLIGDVND